MADPQQFYSWQDVTSKYGPAISDQLQNLNVPISEVGQLEQQFGPNFGMAGSQMAGGGPYVPPGFYQALAGGGQGGQQGPPSGNINLTGWQDPAYQSNLLGAQALKAVGLNPSNTMTVNQTPGAGGAPGGNNFAQSGVTPVTGPMNFDISKAPMPNPNPSIGSVFGAVQPDKPTISGPMQQPPADTNPNWGNMSPAEQNAYMRGQGMKLGARQAYSQEQNQIQQNQQGGLYINPAQQATGAQVSQGKPFATAAIQTPQAQPPATPTALPQPPAAPAGAVGTNYAAYNSIKSYHDLPNPPMGIYPKDTPPSGAGTSPSGAAIATKTMTSIPHFQEGGIVTSPTLAMVGEAGPEAIVPLTDPNYQMPTPQIQGQMPTSQSNAVQRWPLTQMSNYQGPQQQPAQQPPAQQAAPQQAAPRPQAPPAPSGPTQAQALQGGTQVGPPNPTQPTQAQALQSGTQVGPPNPAQQNNPVSSVAQSAANTAINNTLQKMRPLFNQAQNAGAALQQGGAKPRAVQNSIPSPDDFKKNKNGQIVLTGANPGFANTY